MYLREHDIQRVHEAEDPIHTALLFIAQRGSCGTGRSTFQGRTVCANGGIHCPVDHEGFTLTDAIMLARAGIDEPHKRGRP